LVGPDPQTLIAALRWESRLQAERDRYGQFTPVLRFILADPEHRTFRAERMCWLGSIDDWIGISPHGPIQKVARALIPKLGTDAFFERY
jgi:hypothetical protein